MLGSHGRVKKQQPWDESIRVPFLLHYPARFGHTGREVDALLDTVDIMPTLLSLCGLPIPRSVEGLDYTDYLQGGEDPAGGAALLACYHPFGQWPRALGGREFRGLRTRRYTYVRSLEGPWLLYDNETDPYQMTNLVDDAQVRAVRDELDDQLQRRLEQLGDDFLPSAHYIEQWGYPVDESGTVPYTW